ncbi:Mn(2+) uptake NRAMP transporter MntH [Cryptosporangium phraense]|uniref:Mn(2+) uptake NRAMP transporter MntH n=2 Tax=Cryptosporangium phraense TaxID=2593070 RepID=A0A545B0M5_9ACTN|nr:Mn(2+) uptake NRAMP transporter MntH [Cryptosporangium phraense]
MRREPGPLVLAVRGPGPVRVANGPSRTVVRYLGPAFVAAVAYVDPGNLATNVTAGASYGFTLLWVIVVANLAAMLVQYLSGKLGIATGLSLAEACRERYPKPVSVALWLQAEFVVIMTDLAEVVGGAVALNLLFGVPPTVGAVLTVAGMLVILAAQQRGRRPFEAVIASLLGVLVAAFAYQTLRAGVSPAEAVGGLVPRFAGTDSVLLSVGIVGATVMPHAIYLHSALTQSLRARGSRARKVAVRATLVDVVLALAIAGSVNVAILLGATSLSSASSLEEAYAGYGGATAAVFATALLVSSLAASAVGVYSGQVVMQGFIRRSIPLWLRRSVSVLPALVILLLGVDPTSALVLSQVALSFGVPFAIFPLLGFTGDRRLMGDLVNRRATRYAGYAVGGLIVGLNAYLVSAVLL